MDQVNNSAAETETLSFCIALPCYNEEQNIGELLQQLTTGWNSEYKPLQIAVFSSECRDRTEEIVKRFAYNSPIPIALLSENKRSGKCHAINQLIEFVGNVDIVILISSDIQVTSASLIRLLKEFDKNDTGVVAGRPEPVCDTRNLAYRVSKAMWDIHHLMVLEAPKSTEITIFRNLGFRLDESSLVDEAEIEWNITERGYSIKYCPNVIIHNKAPHTLKDHIRQRTRVTLGHLILKKKRKYKVGSLKANTRTNALKKYIFSKNVDYFAFAVLLVVEAWVMLAAFVLSLTRKNITGKWVRIDSAKSKFEKSYYSNLF